MAKKAEVKSIKGPASSKMILGFAFSAVSKLERDEIVQRQTRLRAERVWATNVVPNLAV